MAAKRNAEEIFNEAVGLSDPTKQAEYLEQACGGDEKLRAQVDALLQWHQEAGSFLEVPAVDPNVTLDTSASEGPGAVIGRYKLLERVGEGGMATVYMAEQKHPIRRRVALKVIKLGMDTKQVIARFEAERQALAMMDHPNVAKVLDAGTTETGRPYFVMELVRGVSITEYCDKSKLSTRDRLALFIPVCNAVQHAHHKGIIHRDLKPSNIMVTLHDGKPVPKIIDFGIAKATNQELTEQTVFTRYAQMIGTPEYMSPEQAEMSGLDIDTRSDVYSLGVVLYELVTGVPPFDPDTMSSVGLVEMRRIIQEQEPLRPSSKLSSLGEHAARIAQSQSTEVSNLVKCLSRELEWIPLKAIRKDRTRRYQSALELAEDIQRYLDGAPLSAGPESAVYRARKLIRRHRALVAGIAALLAVLICGIVVSTLFALSARRAQSEAQAVSEFLQNDVLASMNPDVTVSPTETNSREATVHALLDNASEKLEGKFADKPLVEASIRATLGNTYMGLGLYEPAESQLKRAIAMYRTELGAKAPQILKCTVDLGWLHFWQGRYAEAQTVLTETTEESERILGGEDLRTGEVMLRLAWVHNTRGHFEEAERLFVRWLGTFNRVPGQRSLAVARASYGLAFAHHRQGHYEDAEQLYKKSLEIFRREQGEEGMVTLLVMRWLGVLNADLGRYEQAEELLDKALDSRRRILGEEHPLTLGMKCELAGLYTLQGRYEEAELMLVEVLKITKQDASDDSLTARGNLALLYFRQERYDEAEALLPASSIELIRSEFGEDSWTTLLFDGLLGHLYIAQGRYDKAEALLVPAAAASRRVLGQEHPTTLVCTYGLAVLRGKQNRFEEAGQLFTEAWEGARRKLGDDHPDTLEGLHDFGVMYFDQGRYDQAEAKLLAAYEGQVGKLGPAHPMTLKSLHSLIRLYDAWNKPEEAQKWRAKLPERERATR